MITVILSFLNLFSLKKTFTYFFQYFRKSARNSKPKGRTKGELGLFLHIFVKFIVKEPTTKFYGVLVIFHEL